MQENLGYLLSNDSVGVYFTDGTKMILDPNGHHIYYMEQISEDRRDVGTEYTMENFPQKLQSKVSELQHL